MSSLSNVPSQTQPYQDTLRDLLIQRNQAESSHAAIIEQYRKLAKQTKSYKDRNQALLKAATSVRTDGRTGGGGRATPSTAGGDDNPVLQAYVGTLETQLSTLRSELSNVYKLQGQNTQKLLTMTETLQEKEHQHRLDSEELRRLSESETKWHRSTADWQERLKEKDKALTHLQDEITTLTLELNQTASRNDALKKDNASLLQRWVDKMQQEAEAMNLENETGFASEGGKDDVSIVNAFRELEQLESFATRGSREGIGVASEMIDLEESGILIDLDRSAVGEEGEGGDWDMLLGGPDEQTW